MFTFENALEFLIKTARDIDIDIDVIQTQALLTYLNLLENWNKKINLIGPKGNMQEKMILHLLDSLIPLKFIKPDPVLQAADFGSGGGLPAIPLKIMNPGWSYTLIEATLKKTVFLKMVGRRLNFENYQVQNTFLTANQDTSQGRFDLITARGLMELKGLLDLSAGYLKPGGRLWFFKGARAFEELTKAAGVLHKTGLEFVCEWSERLPLLNESRSILVFSKK